MYLLVKKPVNRLLVLRDRLRDLDFYRSVAYQIDDGSDYECTHPRWHSMLRKICEEAGSEDAVLDVGCGKGMMLWFFSRYPFRLVDGIEYNPEIAAIARRNIEKLGLKCRVFVTDACDFTQWENYNWFYFYNPFPDRVMGVCLQYMLDSLRTNPRTLHIIYVNPVCHQLLLDRGFTEVPVEYGLWETLWFPKLRVLRRYQYDPEQLCAMASSEEATKKSGDGRWKSIWAEAAPDEGSAARPDAALCCVSIDKTGFFYHDTGAGGASI